MWGSFCLQIEKKLIHIFHTMEEKLGLKYKKDHIFMKLETMEV